MECRSVVKRYGGNTALSGLDVDIHGGVTGLLGANGAGKTTLITLLLGLRSRDSGSISVLGSDPSTAGPAVRQRLGYAFEQRELPPDFTAFDLVAHMAALHGLPAKLARGRASDTLWEVGLGEERFRPTGTMSTGQLQRVKLAQATAHHPELLILDEPTDGLDPLQRVDMLALIKSLAEQHGINILVSSHHLAEVERICQTVVIINEGRVVRSGAVDKLTGQNAYYLVEVGGEAKQLASSLAGLGYDAEFSPDELMVRVPLLPKSAGETAVVKSQDERHLEVKCADAIRDAVASQEIELRSLVREQQTLERLFADEYSAGNLALGSQGGAGKPPDRGGKPPSGARTSKGRRR